MKKLIAFVLCCTLLISLLSGCGGSAGKKVNIKVAMISGYEDITDLSYNQATYEACSEYCEDAGVVFSYFKADGGEDRDRVSAIEAAVKKGFNVLVMTGYAFAPALEQTVCEYPKVSFVALDMSIADFSEGYELPQNLYCAAYSVEILGFLAGYAAVKLGYVNIGFLGSMAVPEIVSYGLGFTQGVNSAAQGIEPQVRLNFAYANRFFGDSDITEVMDTWYQSGTQIVFACGSGMAECVSDAAVKTDGRMITADIDGSMTIYKKLIVTSAIKNFSATVKTALDAAAKGKFSQYGGKYQTLGIVSEDTNQNHVGLSSSTQFSDSFTEDDYKEILKQLNSGEITVNDNVSLKAEDFAENIILSDYGNLK